MLFVNVQAMIFIFPPVITYNNLRQKKTSFLHFEDDSLTENRI